MVWDHTASQWVFGIHLVFIALFMAVFLLSLNLRHSSLPAHDASRAHVFLPAHYAYRRDSSMLLAWLKIATNKSFHINFSSTCLGHLFTAHNFLNCMCISMCIHIHFSSTFTFTFYLLSILYMFTSFNFTYIFRICICMYMYMYMHIYIYISGVISGVAALSRIYSARRLALPLRFLVGPSASSASSSRMPTQPPPGIHSAWRSHLFFVLCSSGCIPLSLCEIGDRSMVLPFGGVCGREEEPGGSVQGVSLEKERWFSKRSCPVKHDVPSGETLFQQIRPLVHGWSYPVKQCFTW